MLVAPIVLTCNTLPVEVEQHAAQVAEQHQHSALSGREEYDRLYKRSVEDPNAFWRELAGEYHWEQQASS
eukprot:jgi/Astpho2/4543/Aster-x0630